MSFKFFKLQYWGKRSADVRRRNCAELPLFYGVDRQAGTHIRRDVLF